MSSLRATLYPVALLSANTVTAVGLHVFTGTPTALLLGVVTLLLLTGIIQSQYDAGIPAHEKR